MHRVALCIVTGVCVVGVCGLASANVLTFDDVSTTMSMEPIPDGYGGFNWDNFWVIRKGSSVGPGYQTGVVSGAYTAFNAFGDPASIGVAPGSTFDFQSAYLTAAWGDQTIEVEGFLNGVSMNERVVSAVITGPQRFDFDFLGIDTLWFTSTGGTRTQFVMDDFTFHQAVVPLPGAAVLGFLGVGVAALKLRKFA